MAEGKDYSIVEYFGRDEDGGSRCGYCRSPAGSLSDGMWAHMLTVQDYQDLIDRGWRRSGLYCYKPNMDTTCCPLYTIKCSVGEFHLSKSQKKVIKRMNKFLAEGLQSRDAFPEKTKPSEGGMSVDMPDLSTKKQAKLAAMGKEHLMDTSDYNAKKCVFKNASSQGESSKYKSGMECSSNVSKAKVDIGVKPPCKKGKVIRKERRLQKLAQQGLALNDVSVVNQTAKTLEELLVIPKNPKHRLELRLVRSCPANDEFKRSKAASFAVYHKYQVVIHQDPPEKITEKQFMRFLVNSPLEPKASPGKGLGSFHHQYWLDGQLIAVGVLDILPNCVSSVYFYYDPDFGYLSLGTYAALREIALTQELRLQIPDMQSYYLGFYIHSCVKMRYKGQFTPSFLLCPSTYTWHPIETCRPLLDENKYQEFGNQSNTEEVPDISQVLVLIRGKILPYCIYKTRSDWIQDEEEVTRYTKLVGKDCANRMFLVRLNPEVS